MSILADTNILLRRTQPDHPSHTLAVESVAKILATGEPVYFTLQNMSEFWNVATWINGCGVTTPNSASAMFVGGDPYPTWGNVLATGTQISLTCQ